jgi:hypothetical protein
MKNRKHDSRVIDAVNARAKTYRVLCHLMRVDGPSLATRIVAASVQKCHDEAVRLNEQREPGEGRGSVTPSKMLGRVEC